MMYPKLIENLMERLTKLPGIGRRSAERIVYWMLAQDAKDVKALAEGIAQLKEGLRFCKQCNHLSEQELCLVCADSILFGKLVGLKRLTRPTNQQSINYYG